MVGRKSAFLSIKYPLASFQSLLSMQNALKTWKDYWNFELTHKYKQFLVAWRKKFLIYNNDYDEYLKLVERP